MRAETVHLVKHALGLAIQSAFDAKRGKLIGHYPHRPARAVLLPAAVGVRTVGQHLGRRFGFVSRTQRAEATLLHHLVAKKIAGPLGAVRGNDDPPSNYRIFSQFRHTHSPCAARTEGGAFHSYYAKKRRL